MSKKLFKLMFVMLSVLLIGNVSLATKHEVWVGGGGDVFTPQTFTATVGDTVEWNWGFSGYNVESTSIPSGAAPWNSQVHNDPFIYSYVITVPGAYSYKDGTHAGMTGSFTVAPLTSVEDISAAPFKLSPNPAVNNIHFMGDVKSLIIHVYDLNGRELRIWTATNLSDKTFDTRDLAKGLYLLSVNADGKLYNEKLIVAH